MITSYTVTKLIGIVVAVLIWIVLRRKTMNDCNAPTNRVLLLILFGGLGGAGIGAKVAFLLAEGWFFRENVAALLTGHSITGALLGGYVGVECAKYLGGHRSQTGDLFAISVPLGLAIGRLGCVQRGCCPGMPCENEHWWTFVDAAGIHRWPSQLVEMGFNACFGLWAILAMRFAWQNGNRFHIFLISYGLFRFAHEFPRQNPTMLGPLGGYHFIAVFMMVVGCVAYVRRRRNNASVSRLLAS